MFQLNDVRFHSILDIPSLRIEARRITTLVGRSGSGKTTLLRMLNRMASPTSGTILYGGRNLSGVDPVSHRREVSMLSQNPVVFDGDVRRNLTAGLTFQGRTIPGDDILTAVLKQVDLHHDLDAPMAKMSGGEKQRVALGRILLLDSPVYLMDEPSSALDEDMEDEIIGMIAGHVRDAGKTLIMVTHSSRVARAYSDALVTIARGGCETEDLR